jgi:hypothetical protein
MSDDENKTSHEVKPGTIFNLRNQFKNARGVTLKGPGGFRVKFNLPVGQTAQIEAGNFSLDVVLDEPYDELVGA